MLQLSVFTSTVQIERSSLFLRRACPARKRHSHASHDFFVHARAYTTSLDFRDAALDALPVVKGSGYWEFPRQPAAEAECSHRRNRSAEVQSPALDTAKGAVVSRLARAPGTPACSRGRSGGAPGPALFRLSALSSERQRVIVQSGRRHTDR